MQMHLITFVEIPLLTEFIKFIFTFEFTKEKTD